MAELNLPIRVINPDALHKVQLTIRPLVRKLARAAFYNQLHDGDLLALCLHGHYDASAAEFTLADGRRASPFVTGPGIVGNIFQYQYDVLKLTISAIAHSPISSNNSNPLSAFDVRPDFELQAMAYMAIWESEYFVKSIWHLIHLACGKRYNWEKRMPTQGYPEFWRQDIVAPLRNIVPRLSRIIRAVYDRNIRNAIAHRNYFCMGPYIHFYDLGYTKHISTKSHKWERRLLISVAIHQEIIGVLHQILQLYARKARIYHFGQLIAVYDREGALRGKRWMKHNAPTNNWMQYETWATLRK